MTKRARQRFAEASLPPSSAADCSSFPPSAHRGTILARGARNCAVFARLAQRVS
nr:hypothetical protein [Streptomyces graminofaciens]